MFEIVDAGGNVIGLRSRTEVHRDPALLHKVAHVLIFNDAGELLLQKRSLNKDMEPGKWDTSVGGHVAPGENIKDAALREMREELGITCNHIEFLYLYIFSGERESELVYTYKCVHNGPFTPNPDEIDETEFQRLEQIEKSLGSGILSNNFEAELKHYISLNGSA